MKAWLITIPRLNNGTTTEAVYPAETRGKAKSIVALNLREFGIRYTDIQVKRCPSFDELVSRKPEGELSLGGSLGWVETCDYCHCVIQRCGCLIGATIGRERLSGNPFEG